LDIGSSMILATPLQPRTLGTITDFRHFDRVGEKREEVMKAEAASEMIHSWYSAAGVQRRT
jgi:hypothetical protein